MLPHFELCLTTGGIPIYYSRQRDEAKWAPERSFGEPNKKLNTYGYVFRVRFRKED